MQYWRSFLISFPSGTRATSSSGGSAWFCGICLHKILCGKCCSYTDWYISIHRWVFTGFSSRSDLGRTTRQSTDRQWYRSCRIRPLAQRSLASHPLVRNSVRNETNDRQSVSFCLKHWSSPYPLYCREDDPFQGFTVRVGSMGMRLFASEYWKCAETACVDSGLSNLKFVFAESLLTDGSSNWKSEGLKKKLSPDTLFKDSTDQITNFITRHNHQAGIQHIGFTCLNDIKDAVRIARVQGAQFLIPSPQYYFKVCYWWR